MPGENDKRLALFLDGTWNTTDDNTNVWRLKCLCAQTPLQRVYYSAGVGTQHGEKLSGGLFGVGINEEVMAAYEWLIENYEDGAYIYIFGFSRGAFTARSLAGFISRCGLLKAGSPISLPQLYAKYRSGEATSILGLREKKEGLSLEEKRMQKYCRPAPVFFQGVWDTVGALGVPLPLIPNVSAHDFQFLETDLHINDSYAFHALAIDEHRHPFAPTLWTKTVPQTGPTTPERSFHAVEQRWFVGAHSNVGGGYENDLLAQIPLKWIMDKATLHGLLVKDIVDLEDGSSECPIHDSFAEMAGGAYQVIALWKRFYREIGADPQSVDAGKMHVINESIDASVFAYHRANPGYRPQNLEAWLTKRGVKADTIAMAVDAREPKKPIDDTEPLPKAIGV